jgi:heat shock protein HspQ
MSKYVISHPQFLTVFDKLMKKELNKLTKRTHPSYHGWVFWLDNDETPIFTYVPELNLVDVHNELFFRYQNIFDLSLSNFKKLMQKWLSDNLELPEDIKVDFA